MRNLVELGSPNSVYYTVFCCSHVIIAFFIFMILDLTLTLFSLFFELFVIFYRDVPDQIWAIFHGASLITMVSGFFAICDNPTAIIFFGCRVSLILAVTIARFIGYHDVDEDLRLEVRRKYEEFEASIDAAPKED
ncbi:hypothetical protein GCK72_003538 [Caenorhabditis remanei]|uniref:Uncharacterized protein n=1 Tax=Caenorhabditis remanei TaxID=31234 RepID=A0A6A5HWM1_CAERE|nr:hypothetical protein GCK72_003538 [Caenorhabditis remanei]KAF1771711.1 hypothetical protein GCK72_003538 [Caenorhabditis remanei]